MPSEDRIAQALEVLSEARESFLSSVAMSAEEVRGILERESNPEEGPEEKLAHELGPFAEGRIDLEKLVPFASGNSKLAPAALAEIKKAYETLTDLYHRGDGLFQAKVELDGYLRGAIVGALAKAGSAFGAARTVEWALHELPHPEGLEDVLDSFPPHYWNRAEKGVSPPLVLEVEGQDLKASSLGDLLEGSQKIILVVNGPAAPAPLVRLITPGVAVLQTEDPADLAALGALSGPGIAALMPEGSAKFLHVPGDGKTLRDRLVVGHLPEKEQKRAIGSISAFQQTEELRQLTALATAVRVPEVAAPEPVAVGAGPELDEAGQLAAWLIHQAGV